MEALFPVRVYMEDTDTGGIVYYVNYLKFMERARTELLRRLGFEQQSMKDEGLLFVVHNLNSRYLQPARLDNELRVKTVIQALSPASIVFGQEVIRAGDGVLLCRAEVKIATVCAETLKPVRLPPPMRQALDTFTKQI